MSILDHYIEAHKSFSAFVVLSTRAKEKLDEQYFDFRNQDVVKEAADAVDMVSYFEEDFDYVDFFSQVTGAAVELRLKLNKSSNHPTMYIDLPDLDCVSDPKAVYYG